MRNNIIVRLVAYYVTFVLLSVALLQASPEVPRYIDQERGRVARSADARPADILSPEETALPGVAELLTPARSVPVVVALLTAFMVTLPVVWVYRWTRPRKRYSQVFAHTLLLVPIGIALVVFLVKGSLALAFSLAGIVAALRFRTTLDDPMDAVYMFIVVGAGLAAGVQLLAIAFIASVVFNVTALAVWKSNFGEYPAVLSGWSIVPVEAAGLLPSGTGLTPNGAGHQGPAKSPFNARLRVQTTQVATAERAVIPILEDSTKNWQLSQVTQLADGSSVVEFDLRLRKSVDLAAFLREIEQSERAYIGKVELKQHKAGKE